MLLVRLALFHGVKQRTHASTALVPSPTTVGMQVSLRVQASTNDDAKALLDRITTAVRDGALTQAVKDEGLPSWTIQLDGKPIAFTSVQDQVFSPPATLLSLAAPVDALHAPFCWSEVRGKILSLSDVELTPHVLKQGTIVFIVAAVFATRIMILRQKGIDAKKQEFNREIANIARQAS